MATARPKPRSAARTSPRRRLSADDWAHAALAAMTEGGLRKVAIEPLAVRLGATKGSFYWHFPNRRALVDAALTLWEEQRTEAVISAMEDESEPVVRLRRLFAGAIKGAPADRTEIALLASADDPQVASAIRRVTERRVEYIAKLFEELGLKRGEAHFRSLLVYTAYLGYSQLAHAVPDVLPTGADRWNAYVDHVLNALLPKP